MLLPDTVKLSVNEVVVQLYEQARDDVYYYVLRIGLSPEQAQDVAQEVFLKLYAQLRAGDEIYNPRGWIFRVAHNEALKLKARTIPQLEIAPGLEPEDPRPSAESELLDKSSRARLQKAIAELSPQQRQVLHLRSEGLRLREIGETIGIKTSTVNEFLRRAVARLKKVMDE